MPTWFSWVWEILHQHKEEKMPKIKKKYTSKVCCQHCGAQNKTLRKLNSKYYFCSSCLEEVH